MGREVISDIVLDSGGLLGLMCGGSAETRVCWGRRGKDTGVENSW